MIRSLIPLSAAVLLAAATAQQISNEQIKTQLAKMRAAEPRMMNIDPPEGEFLYSLVKKLNAKRVLEIGTSNGYSGIWLAMGLRETGGRLITLEIDQPRHALAQANFKAAGLSGLIDSRLTDAVEATRTLEGPFDLVFIDAWKPDYLKYYENVIAKVRKGGAITAHNVSNYPAPMQGFLDKIHSDPAVRTEIVNLGPQGLSVSWKQ